MTLKLADEMWVKKCPQCKGRGTVPCPRLLSAHGKDLPGAGHPIPCPTCKGKKEILR